MHIVCLYTSSYFPIHDDEYRRVHYDDDHHHALNNIQMFIGL